MIHLPTVTLWAMVRSGDKEYTECTVRVVRYCCRLFKFNRVVFMTRREPVNCPSSWELIQIPNTDLGGANIFHVHVTPLLLQGPGHFLSVHEDGFPIDPSLWTDEFLDYDYIGAPWAASSPWVPGGQPMVGNGGFYLESRRCLDAKARLPFLNPDAPEAGDVFPCITHRAQMEQAGVRFAPPSWLNGSQPSRRRRTRRASGFTATVNRQRNTPKDGIRSK